VDAYALLTMRFQLVGDVRAIYAYGKPDNRRRDVANLEKGVSDTLQRWGILKDDSQIADLRLYWSDDVEKGMVRVELEEI
jgi:Holliday junction resolvase RusA-like endonuclease